MAMEPGDVLVAGLQHRFEGERSVDVLAGVDLDLP